MEESTGLPQIYRAFSKSSRVSCFLVKLTAKSATLAPGADLPQMQVPGSAGENAKINRISLRTSLPPPVIC